MQFYHKSAINRRLYPNTLSHRMLHLRITKFEIYTEHNILISTQSDRSSNSNMSRCSQIILETYFIHRRNG